MNSYILLDKNESYLLKTEFKATSLKEFLTVEELIFWNDCTLNAQGNQNRQIQYFWNSKQTLAWSLCKLLIRKGLVRTLLSVEFKAKINLKIKRGDRETNFGIDLHLKF